MKKTILGLVLLFSVQLCVGQSYLYHRQWLVNPADSFLLFTGIAVSQKYVYVSDQRNYEIIMYDTLGNFLRTWGSSGTATGLFGLQDAIATDDSSFVYVVDHGNDRVQKFDSLGNFKRQFAGVTYANTRNFITIAPNGSIYVADYSFPSRTTKLNKNGTLSAVMTATGLPLGIKWQLAGGVAIKNKHIWTSSNSPQRTILIFDTLMNYQCNLWAGYGTTPGTFLSINNLSIDKCGYLYTAESATAVGSSKVQKFDSLGYFIGVLANYGLNNGQVYSPWDVKVDNKGFVYISDRGNKRIQVFRPNPNPVITFNFPDSVYVNDPPILLTATATSGLRVTYVSSDLAIATISSVNINRPLTGTITITGYPQPSISFLQPGTVTITAMQPGDACNYGSPNVSKRVVVRPSTVTGLKDADAASFKIFPNPTNGVVTIQCDAPNDYKILDGIGSIVKNGYLNLGRNIVNLELSKGIYYFISNGIVRKLVLE